MDDFLAELSSFEKRPYDFALWAFEGGVELEIWQKEVLQYIQSRLEDYDGQPIRVGVRSGHGVGKTTVLAILNIWAFTTFPDTRGVITANTKVQLQTKTWVELSKWMRRFIGRELFKLTATGLFPNETNPAKEWRIDLVPWSKENPDAFAGLHNQGKRVIMTFDEAALIDQVIWETSEGVETDANTQIIRLAMGNATSKDGFFYQLFEGGRFSDEWKTWKVSSYDVSITNKQKLDAIVKVWGPDHDVTRVRVLGEFPYQSGDSFISYDSAERACRRKPPSFNNVPVVVGVDVGRHNDPSVLYARQGLDAQSRQPLVLRNLSAPQLAAYIIAYARQVKAVAVMVDSGSIGLAVLDILFSKRVGKLRIVPVPFGGKAMGWNEEAGQADYKNRRAEIWGAMRAWLERGSIVNEVKGYDAKVINELCSPKMILFKDDAKIQLESKRSMRSRGVESPNIADALACTFAEPVEWSEEMAVPAHITKPYQPFSLENVYGRRA